MTVAPAQQQPQLQSQPKPVPHSPKQPPPQQQQQQPQQQKQQQPKSLPQAGRAWWEKVVVQRSSYVIDDLVAHLSQDSSFLQKVHPQGGSIALLERSEVQIGERLGHGTFSSVYEVTGINLDSEYEGSTSQAIHVRKRLSESAVTNAGVINYAIKQLKPQLLHNSSTFEAAAADLIMEAKYLSLLNHPNILQIRGLARGGSSAFSSGSYDGYFIVCDRLVETLDTRIKKWRIGQDTTTNKFPCKLQIALQVANALDYLHEQRLIFRDLKPQNIGMAPDDTVKLFDFGFCRELPDPSNAEMSLSERKGFVGCSNPNNGAVLNEDAIFCMSGKGTLMYMATEVLATRLYNCKADVYSWAMVFYEMLVLRKPFPIYTIGMHRKNVCERGDRPHLYRSNIPPCVQYVLKQAWERKVSERWTMRRVCHELKKVSLNLDNLTDLNLQVEAEEHAKCWQQAVSTVFCGMDQLLFIDSAKRTEIHLNANSLKSEATTEDGKVDPTIVPEVPRYEPVQPPILHHYLPPKEQEQLSARLMDPEEEQQSLRFLEATGSIADRSFATVPAPVENPSICLGASVRLQSISASIQLQQQQRMSIDIDTEDGYPSLRLSSAASSSLMMTGRSSIAHPTQASRAYHSSMNRSSLRLSSIDTSVFTTRKNMNMNMNMRSKQQLQPQSVDLSIGLNPLDSSSALPNIQELTSGEDANGVSGSLNSCQKSGETPLPQENANKETTFLVDPLNVNRFPLRSSTLEPIADNSESAKFSLGEGSAKLSLGEGSTSIGSISGSANNTSLPNVPANTDQKQDEASHSVPFPIGAYNEAAQLKHESNSADNNTDKPLSSAPAGMNPRDNEKKPEELCESLQTDPTDRTEEKDEKQLRGSSSDDADESRNPSNSSFKEHHKKKPPPEDLSSASAKEIVAPQDSNSTDLAGLQTYLCCVQTFDINPGLE